MHALIDNTLMQYVWFLNSFPALCLVLCLRSVALCGCSCLTDGTRLLFTVFNFALLLLGEELPHLLVPLQCPLVDHHKVPRVGLQPRVHAAAQALTLACRKHIPTSRIYTV